MTNTKSTDSLNEKIAFICKVLTHIYCDSHVKTTAAQDTLMSTVT